MRLTYDARADMAYVYFVKPTKDTVRHDELVFIEDEALHGGLKLDLDESGRMLGIEVFNAGRQLHQSMRLSHENQLRLTYDPGTDIAYVYFQFLAFFRAHPGDVLSGGGQSAVDLWPEGRLPALRPRRPRDRKSIVFQHQLLHGVLVVDLDKSGHILGIEVFRAREQLPASLLASG